MRILKLTFDSNEQRSDTVSILKGENQLRVMPFHLSAKDVIMVLQDSYGLRRRVHFIDAPRQAFNENVTSFSSFWFESRSDNKQLEIEVELK